MNWMQAVMDAKKAGAVYPGDQQQKGTTMSEKYIDLADRIKRGHGDDEVREGIDYALHWLDAHPYQVPGRTITRTEYRDTLDHAVKISGHGDDWESGFFTGLTVGGTKVVPDPEPTNAEKLADDIREVDGGHNLGAGVLAERLASLGWTKAPGGDDD